MPPSFKLFKQRQLCFFLVDFLEQFFGITEINLNKFTKSGYYPDIHFQFHGKNIIIEIDEHQHKSGGASYSKDREEKRIAALRSEFHPLIMVRINPDKYRSRPAMFAHFDDSLRGIREIRVNSGEVEVRFIEIKKVLRGLLLLLRMQEKRKHPHEIKLFFDT